MCAAVSSLSAVFPPDEASGSSLRQGLAVSPGPGVSEPAEPGATWSRGAHIKLARKITRTYPEPSREVNSGAETHQQTCDVKSATLDSVVQGTGATLGAQRVSVCQDDSGTVVTAPQNKLTGVCASSKTRLS